ncbi:MAG: hypothetical protein GX444_03075 [Myxococcales bacterium]|nr:hypothetical protein [Myxococcales bacterium]
MKRTGWVVLFLFCLFPLFTVGCEQNDCHCDDDDAAGGTDDDAGSSTDDDDNDDDSTPPLVCVEGERRCGEGDVPEECAGNQWVTLAACPRMQYCNFGECLDTLVDLPIDETPHLSIVEWWYWTGNLTGEDGNVYGFEITFFYGTSLIGLPIWSINTAIIDLQGGVHREEAWLDYHDADETPGELHLISRTATVDRWDDSNYEIAFSADEYDIEMILTDLKGPIFHGGNGSVRMSSRTTDSFYYSRPRLDVAGTLFKDGAPLAVAGEAWMDHQWGNFVPFVLVGWDWFSMRLDDGAEIMFFIFRSEEHNPAAVDMALGTYVDPDGDQTILSQDEVIVTPLGSWTSPTTGATYPQNWRFEIPGYGTDVTITSVMPDQEVPNIFWNYWEGLSRVTGKNQDEPVNGVGFVELSGYAGRPIFWFLFDVWDDSKAVGSN